MAIKASDIPFVLAHRIEVAHPAPAIFAVDETDEWPAHVLDVLIACAVLKEVADRAESTLCPGCEWQCHKTVVVRSARGRSHTEAFIPCDEGPSHGRISVPLRRLSQYITTLGSLCAFIAGQMKLGAPRASIAGGSFLLGTIKGRNGPRQIGIGLDAGRLILRVGAQEERVTDVLRWVDTSLSIDKAHIRRLANRKDAVSRSRVSRPPDRTARDRRRRVTLAMHAAIVSEAKRRRSGQPASWTAIATAIAATDLAMTEQGYRLSAATVRRIVTEKRRHERESFRSNSKIRNPF